MQHQKCNTSSLCTVPLSPKNELCEIRIISFYESKSGNVSPLGALPYKSRAYTRRAAFSIKLFPPASRISSNMYSAHILFFLFTLGTVSAGSSYSKLTHNCAIVNIKNDKSKPGLGCQCETGSGESASCQAEFSKFLVNNNGKLQPRLKYIQPQCPSGQRTYEKLTDVTLQWGGICHLYWI